MYWKPFCLFSLILCLLAFLGCSDDTSDKMIDAGDVNEDSSFRLAPNFTLLNTELEEVSLSDYQGKVVMVDFWATWCKPCQEEIPHFIELYDDYQAQGFEMIGISTDDVEVRLKDIELFFPGSQ
jgi:thiol-disulfide isomerase/thioredoxin